MIKELTKEEISEIISNIASSNGSKRRLAAKKIGQYNLTEIGDLLFNAYKKENRDNRTWETQCAMIKSLGKIIYKNILPYLEKIIAKNKKEDYITAESALAFVRITRDDINDASPIIQLIEKGHFSVLDGALSALAFDDMNPNEDMVNRLIFEIDNMEERRLFVRGAGDVREYILSASSSWDRNNLILKSFIEKCLSIKHIKDEGYIDKIKNRKKFMFE